MKSPLPLALTALLIATVAFAQDNWKEFSYPKDGFAAQYPAEPKIEERSYQTALGSSVTERVYSFNSGGVVYMVAIADFSRIRPDKDKAIDEAAHALISSGKLTHDVSARIDWNYGREIRVEDNDGTSYTDAIFLIDNKLFQLKVVYPANNTDPVGSSGIHLFQQAFRLLH
jgi:hypothetical protein